MSEEAFNEKFWDEQIWVTKDTDYNTTSKKRVELFKRYVCKKGLDILDIGSADGEISSRISDGNRVTGLEISNQAISIAKKRHPEINFVKGSADEKYPFGDKSFDAIFAGDVIEHIVDTETFIRECQRVLKDGGIIMITTPYHDVVKNILISLFNYNKHYDVRGQHLRFFTKKSITELIEENGFKIIGFHKINALLPRDMAVIARKRKKVKIK
jgi:ubiquinone/menaquinone biosynthesis C-methylase UbiE